MVYASYGDGMKNTNPPLLEVYRALLSAWGPQHWWPGRTRLEIMVGAILTQNTAWVNVEKAIRRLRKEKALRLDVLSRVRTDTLARWIRSAGYFNVKARRLKAFVRMVCDRYGGDLNRMARQGRKFTHFYVTAGVCTPSRASLMTGCYSQRVGMHDNPRDGWVLRPLSPYGLNPDEVTIAEVLKQQGYATAIIGKWHLGDQPEFLPTRQGFDSFFGIPYSDDMTARVWEADGSRWPPLPLMENESVIEAPVDRDGLTKRYTERAMQWIAEHKDGPFFLYFPQAMPGSTRTPFASAQFKGKSKNGPWGDAIEEVPCDGVSPLGERLQHPFSSGGVVVPALNDEGGEVGVGERRDDLGGPIAVTSSEVRERGVWLQRLERHRVEPLGLEATDLVEPVGPLHAPPRILP